MTRQDEAAEPLYVIKPADEAQESTSDAAPPLPADTQAASFLDNIVPTLLLVFGLLLLIGVLLRLLRKNTARAAATPDSTPRERIDRIRSDAGSRSHVETYSAEAEELTRRLSAIMDNKAARLELLIQEADERLARLTQAESAVRTRPHEPEAHAFRRTPPPPEPVDAADPTHRRICELADEGLDPVQIAQRLEQPIGQVELVLNLHRRRA